MLSGLSAGILITIGGSVFLACDSRYVGAVMFSVALLCICLKGYALFTGKVGFMPEKHGREEFSVLLLGLLGNAIGTILGGYLIRAGLPALGDAAQQLCEACCCSRQTNLCPRAVLRHPHVPGRQHLPRPEKRDRHPVLHSGVHPQRI